MVSGQEKEAAMPAAQQGVELLFPAGTGKQEKGVKLSKEQKKAVSLLQKLKAIEKGGDVNAVDKLGQTALMHAAAQDNRLAVSWLVARGADASIKSKKGKTAGSVAHGDMTDFLTALEKEKQPLSRQEARDMLTYQGREMGEVGVIKQLLKEREEEGWKMEYFHGGPMELALLYRLGARKFSFPEDLSSVEAEPLQLLRALGVKTDIVDPLLQIKIALRLKQKETVLALLKQDPSLLQNPDIFSSIPDEKTLQALLDAGLDAKNEKLMEEVINKGDGAMLRTLLKAGATVPDPNKPLESKYGEKNAAFVLALIDAGANADALNTLSVGMSPIGYGPLSYYNSATLLHLAADGADLTEVQLLLAHGANPNAPGKKAKDDQEEPYGMTPLMAAANSAMQEVENAKEAENAVNRTEIVKRLLEAGANVHAKDSAGNGVIYYAVCGGRGESYGELPCRVSKKAEADILSMVEQLIKAGADVPRDILTHKLRSEISSAGREKLALMLLDAGADPLAKSEEKRTTGWTTLMVNGIWGPKIAKRLLDAGVDPSVKCKTGSWETSAMSLAMEKGAVEVVKLLKEKGIDPGELEVVEPEKLEPLLELGARIPKDMTNRLLGNMTGGHVSSPLLPYEDYVDIIQILKRHGYTPNLIAWTQEKSGLGTTDFNQYVLRAFFKTGENPNEVDENGDSLLFHFLSTKKFDLPTREMARALPIFREAGADFNHKNKTGNSLLTYLASSNAWADEVLPAFIEAGGDVNKPIDQDGQTPLFYAGDAETIAQLLRAGADAHVRDAKGRTPLFPCHVSRRDADEVRLLMQRGVFINAQDNEGNTALMMAVARDRNSSVQALLDAGADPNIKNKAGKTALQIAKEKKDDDIIKLLKEHGAKEETVALPSNKKSDPSNMKKNDLNERDGRGRTRLMLVVLKNGSEGEIQSLLRQGADVNARDDKGNTALHCLLTVEGNIDARLNALLAAHPDVNLATHQGTTPLMILDVCRDSGERVFRVKKLLELHAKVDLKDAEGRTVAMRYVEKNDNAEALRLLLDAGADTELKNKDGKTLLQLAQQHKRTACVRLLQERLTPPSPAKPLPASSSGHWWWYIIGGVLLILLIGCVGRRLRRRKQEPPQDNRIRKETIDMENAQSHAGPREQAVTLNNPHQKNPPR